MPNIVLILGSAADVVRSRSWSRDVFTSIVAINNAWAVRPDYDYLIHADDFPDGRMPKPDGLYTASVIRSDAYVTAQNKFGGFVYAGGTMAFTAGYWALHTLKPDVLAFLGCDMMYPPSTMTHFYGVGTADPLRDDVTLKSLEAKAARLFIKALRRGTICLNLSDLSESRLAIPRVTLPFLNRLTTGRAKALKAVFTQAIRETPEAQAEALEAQCGYMVENGKYWERMPEFDDTALRQIDHSWSLSAEEIPTSANPRDGCWKRGGVRKVAHG
ncbi:MAG: hypothetical protein NTV73_08160 [Hyphomicrobiales bacterium]|nr:hypothetical protein [Hyphomicrobiales bacterium]